MWLKLGRLPARAIFVVGACAKIGRAGKIIPRRFQHGLVDRGSACVAAVILLNLLCHGGRVPRQDPRFERGCAGWLFVSRCHGDSRLVAGAPGDRIVRRLMKIVLRTGGIVLLLSGLI
jgi:hypothetical protein